MTKTKLTLEEQYKRASKAQKRVLIAKDAIKQIEIGRYVAEGGTYFRVLAKGSEDNLKAGLCDGVKCSLCAKGAIFASKVRCDPQVEHFEIIIRNKGTFKP